MHFKFSNKLAKACDTKAQNKELLKVLDHPIFV